MRAGWEYKKLGDIISPAIVLKNREGKDLPILSITMHDGIVSQKERFKKKIASVDTKDYKIVKNGQLVIAFPIDEGLLYTQDVVDEGIMSPAYNIWDVDYNLVIRKFLILYLHSNFAFAYYRSKLRGTTMRRRNIPREDLLSMPLHLPPIPRQRLIVSELDKINSLIALKREQLKKYDELAQSLFYEMFGDPVENERKLLGEIITIPNGLVDPKQEPYASMIHVGPANIKSNDGTLVDLKTAREEGLISGKYLFNSGMLLYSKIRPNLNKVTLASFTGICSADMYPLVPNPGIESRYLLFILRSDEFLKYAIAHSGRANIPKINRDALLKFETILPPLPLQQLFAHRIEQIEEQKKQVTAAIAKLETLLASRMQYWFE